jgi:hypothetical protein
MKRSSALYGAGILLTMIVSCSSGGDQPTTELPPVTDAPAATTDGYQVSVVTDGGTIGGAITVSGTIPALPARRIGQDPQVCGTGSRPSERLLVNTGGGLKNAVVIVEGVRSGKAIPAAL